MNTYNGQDKIDSDRPSEMPAARSCRSQSVARVEHTDHDLERTCRIPEIGSQHDDRAAIFAGSDSVLGVISGSGRSIPRNQRAVSGEAEPSTQGTHFYIDVSRRTRNWDRYSC